jgi:hypothetical protein
MPKTLQQTQALARVESLIVTVRGHRIILDKDLAAIYGVSTKRLNEQVRRNQDRFPEDFAFQLTGKEWKPVEVLRSQNATLSSHGDQPIRSQNATASSARLRFPVKLLNYLYHSSTTTCRMIRIGKFELVPNWHRFETRDTHQFSSIRMKTSELAFPAAIEQRIFLIRGHKVMLGPYLASLYGIETRVLMQAVKRNRGRFPDDFMFALTRNEIQGISQFVTSLKNSYGRQCLEVRSSRATCYGFC